MDKVYRVIIDYYTKRPNVASADVVKETDKTIVFAKKAPAFQYHARLIKSEGTFGRSEREAAEQYRDECRTAVETAQARLTEAHETLNTAAALVARHDPEGGA